MRVGWLILGMAGCGNLGIVSTDFPEPGTLAVEPGLGLTFGEASPHGKSVRDEFSLSASDGDVDVVDAWVEEAPDAFETYGKTFPVTIRDGTDTSIVMRFTPPDTGRYDGILVLELGDETTVSRTLLGMGCEDPDGDGYC